MARTCSWSAIPSAPSSANPEEKITAARTPIVAASAITSGTCRAAVKTNARSTSSGAAVSVATQGIPSISVVPPAAAAGLTAKIGPGYPNRCR